MQRRAEEEERRHYRREGEERVHARGRELVGEVGAEEGEREMCEVDLPEQSPSEAQAEAKEPVQGADEDAGK